MLVVCVIRVNTFEQKHRKCGKGAVMLVCRNVREAVKYLIKLFERWKIKNTDQATEQKAIAL